MILWEREANSIGDIVRSWTHEQSRSRMEASRLHTLTRHGDEYSPAKDPNRRHETRSMWPQLATKVPW